MFTAFAVKADRASGHRMTEDEVVAQMRTTISAGYETVSAIVAVSIIPSCSALSSSYL
jgi:cytochrome P450